jgi:hypothetical protein
MTGLGAIKQLGTVSRTLSEVTASGDLRCAAVATSDFHGDVWLRKVDRC